MSSKVVGPMVDAAVSALNVLASELAAKEPKRAQYYANKYDVREWIASTTSSSPSLEYLSSSPISFHLILLTQMANVLSFAEISGATLDAKSFQSFVSQIKSTTGHSQGLIAAVVLSASSSVEELVTRTVEACKYALLLGTRGQQVSDTLQKEVETGLPPMLVTGRQSARSSRARKLKRKPPKIDQGVVGKSVRILHCLGARVDFYFFMTFSLL